MLPVALSSGTGDRAAGSVASARGVAALCAALGLAAFALNLAIELWLDGRGAFAFYNLFFEADPHIRIAVFAHGWGDRGIDHPLLSLMFSIPIRGAASVAGSLAPGVDAEALRRSLALGVAPLFSASGTALVCLLSLRLGFGRAAAAAIAGIHLASFSTLVFGSIPDHFAIGGFTVIAGYALYALAERHPRYDRWGVWLAVAAAAAAVTITNVAMVVILYTCRRWAAGGLWPAVRAGAALGAAALAVVLGLATVASWVQREPAPLAVGTSQSSEIRLDGARALARLAEFPVTVVQAFFVGRVAVKDNAIAIQENARYRFQFTLEEPASYGAKTLIPDLLVIAALAAGAWGWWRAPEPAHRYLGVASLAILAFNGVLHAVHGDDLILYSQHWHAASVMLLAGAAALAGRRQAAALVVFLAIAAAVNAVGFGGMLETLARTS